MRLPKEIQGTNKLRDYKICMLYIDGKSPEEIKEIGKYKITPRRIHQIIYDNADFINKRIGWHKSKRIQWLRKQIEKRGDSKKDAADLLEMMRKELVEDKPLIDQSQHFTYKYDFVQNEEDHTELPTSRLSERDS